MTCYVCLKPVKSIDLRTQLEAKPELEAALAVLLELQRRNPHADPAALAGICQGGFENESK